MEKELYYIRFLQFSVLLLTALLFYSVSLVSKGKVDLHRKINYGILAIVAVAVAGLITTLFLGFDYKSLTPEKALINIGPESMTDRLLYHRMFSTPLFFFLIATGWTGAKKKPSHKLLARITLFFWMGCLTTALIFF